MSRKSTIKERKICWPDPDLTCLEGGCIHCDDIGKWRSMMTIMRYAKEHPVLFNRGNGTPGDSEKALRYGLENGFFGRVSVR